MHQCYHCQEPLRKTGIAALQQGMANGPSSPYWRRGTGREVFTCPLSKLALWFTQTLYHLPGFFKLKKYILGRLFS